MRPALPCILGIVLLVLPVIVTGAAIPALVKVATVTTPQYAIVQTYVIIPKTTTAVPTTYSTGSVLIESSPPGAEIWIGGSDLRQVTPYSIPVTAGVAAPAPYQLVLKYPGYQDYSVTVTPRFRETQTVYASLVPLTNVVDTGGATTLILPTETSVPTTKTPSETILQTPSRSATTAMQPSIPIPAVSASLPATTGTTEPVPDHTPRRVPGFEGLAVASTFACILTLKRRV